MNKFLLLGAAFVLASCATVQQNIDARKYLEKCKYEYDGLDVRDVHFSSGILIDSVDFTVKVKITDTTDRDVALDHADLDFFLDGNEVIQTKHKRFVRLAPQESTTEPIAATLPIGGILKTLGHRPETMEVKAKLWVTLLVGKDTWKTPIVIPVDYSMPVPWDKIDAFVDKKKKELEAKAADEAKSAAKNVLNKLKL